MENLKLYVQILHLILLFCNALNFSTYVIVCANAPFHIFKPLHIIPNSLSATHTPPLVYSYKRIS